MHYDYKVTSRLSAAEAGPLTVDLGLDLAGTGIYILRVDVVSDTSGPTVSAAVELAMDQTVEGEMIEDRPPPSGAINTEDADGREENVCRQEVVNLEA